MEIRFYTPEMAFIGVMENQTSLTWTRKFFEPGKAVLVCPLTAENLMLTELGNLIWKRGSSEAAVIEDRNIIQNASTARIEVSGRFLSSYMDRRLIMPTVSFDGLVEVAMRQLLSNATAIPLVELGDLNGFTDAVTFQATYKNLLTYETKLSKCSNIGFRFRPDFEEKAIYFETYKGVDHSRSQNTNHRVTFSDYYDNLNEISYRENDQTLKTTVYIRGKDGNTETVVSYGTDLTGLARRELFIDASDVKKESGMTTAQWQEKLLQRGHEQNTNYELIETINSKTNANANFVYRQDYDLGDIVTVQKKDWGISVDLRITEIEEIYEHGALTVSPVFGSVLPETIDWGDN